LKTLGFDVQLDEVNHEMTVTGLGGNIPAKKQNSSSAMQARRRDFLSAFLTLGNGEYILDGEPRMRERPIGDLVEALEQLGMRIQPLETDQ
jgi:3-phosphoshikimate 1-carboxyvinyltransferase